MGHQVNEPRHPRLRRLLKLALIAAAFIAVAAVIVAALWFVYGR
jgi:flagellar biosynthesis/type III secretory pathway M-ring protein FliF/YscJ